ncbi:RNA 2'-phosphotransferase [Sinosporangium siamense]|uniref:Probable RNA 2'-phosphotransferase n=1 Tax=Sinosporangium siamense TaxID=1367973 RepID=A0A919REZ2_9ACTN|nr:RNA 2'-phosphotransferase [Sinosporangium siamense]GII90641.1 putative RNA 2'-phosphotransferase [Sinosporangium siamense]
MNERRMVRVSKYLARHLRHCPDRIEVTLDAGGWVDVRVLLEAAEAHGFPISEAELRQVVAANDKQRFVIAGDRIRASQGHSVPVELDLPVIEPPEVLFHGTVGRNVAAIREQGLLPMGRHHVHLSADRVTATAVGARRGVPVVLVVAAGEMWADGHEFRVSANGVWLVDQVPVGYLQLPG